MRFLFPAFLLTITAVMATEPANPFLLPPLPRTNYTYTELHSDYSPENLEAAAAVIKAVPRPADNRPLFKAKFAEAVNRSAALKAQCVTDANATNNRVDIRCLANCALWAAGDNSRLAPALSLYRGMINGYPSAAATQTKYGNHEIYFEPLLLEWLETVPEADGGLTEAEKQTARQKYLDYSQQGITNVQDYNNPPGIKLFGLALQNLDQAEIYFHDGAVLGDPSHYNPGAVGGHKQTLTFQSLLVPEGPNVEGLGYTAYHAPFLWFALAWRELTGQDVYRLRHLQEWPLHFVYEAGNNFEFQFYEPFATKTAFGIGGPNFHPMLALWEIGLTPTNRELAGLCKSLLTEDRLKYLGLPTWLLYEAIRDPALTPVDKATLPLTRVFRGANYVCARSSWSGSDATILQIGAPVYHLRELGTRGFVLAWVNGAMVLGQHQQNHNYLGGNRTNTLNIYRTDKPGVTYIPLNAIDHAQSYNLKGNFGSDGPSVDELMALTTGRDNLRSVVDTAAELRVEISGEQFWQATKGDPVDPLKFTFITSEPWLTRQWLRRIIWEKPDVLVVYDRLILESGDYAHSRWNFGPAPSVTGSRGIVDYNFTTPYNQAHARLAFEVIKPQTSLLQIGGRLNRNDDIFGAKRRDRLPASIDTLPESDYRNQLLGLWRIQVPSDTSGEWLTVFQFKDISQQPELIGTSAVVVGSKTINYGP